MKQKVRMKRLAGRISDYEKNMLPKSKYDGMYHKPGSMKK